jgi:hypothetical protein
MNRFNITIILSILLSSFSLGAAYLFVDRVELSILIIAINILILFGYWLKILWTSHLILLFNTIFICFGIFVSIPTWLLLMALIGVIAYWDLNGFLIRVDDLKNSESLAYLKERHLGRLLIVLICSGLISAFSIIIEIQINFLSAVTVSIISVVGLGLAIRISARIN